MAQYLVKDGKQVATQWSTAGSVTAMAWKDDILAFGDTDGRLCFWNLGTKDLKTVSVCKSSVKRLQFSHVADDYTIAVLHVEGFSIWNLSTMICEHHLLSKDLPHRIVDVDLCGEKILPIMLTSDGALFANVSAMRHHFSDIRRITKDALISSFLVPPQPFLLRVLLVDPIVREQLAAKGDLLDFASLFGDADEANDPSVADGVLHHIQNLTSDVKDGLKGLDDVSARAHFVSKLFGDEWDIHFWAVARTKLDKKYALPTSYDILCDKTTFLTSELLRCSAFNARRATYDQLCGHVELLLLLKRTDEAVQLLLTMDPSHTQYLNDVYRACLIAAVQSSTECQSTIKLAATNLIASGKLTDGCWLLNLINLNLDAAKYLQSHGCWYKAGWLAKLSLDDATQVDILRKWADHLCSPHLCHKTSGLLLLISLGQFEKVFEMLVDLRLFHLAVWLFQGFSEDERNRVLKETSSRKLLQMAYSEWTKILHQIGLRVFAQRYCELASEI